MAEQVQVTIGAKIDELITEFQKAAQGVNNSVQQISSVVKTAMDKVEQSTNEATGAMRRMERESNDVSRGMIGSFGRVGSFLQGTLGGIVGGFSLKLAVDQVIQFADTAESLQKTAQIAGTTATAISRLHASATPLGITGESVNSAMMKLSRTMVDAIRGGDESAKAFEAVGLKVQDLKNMTPEQVIAKIADKFKDSEDGATKSAVAMALMGRSGAEMVPWLNQGANEMERLADEGEAAGSVMSEDMVASGAALDDAMDKLAVSTQGLKNLFASSFAPVLQFIAESFTDGSGAATDFGTVFKGVASIVVGAVALIRQSWNIVSSIVRAITVSIAAPIDAIAKAARGDFAGAKQALATGREMMFDELSTMVDKGQELEAAFKKTMSNIWDAPKPKGKGAAEQEGPKGELDFKAKEDGSGGAAASKAAAAAKAAARDKFDYEMELLRNEMSEAQKGAEGKLNIAQQMTARVKEMYGEQSREYARAIREEARITEEVEAEKRRIKDLGITKARDHAEYEIQLERGKADYLLATGQINAVQRQQIERNAEEQLYAMQLSFLQQRLALMATEPQEVERINSEIEKLNMEHHLRRQSLDTEQFAVNKQQWDGYFQTINDAMANSIQAMIFQQQSWREALGNITQQVIGQFIQMGVRMLTNWVATQLGMTAATVTGAAVRTTAEVSSAKASTAATSGAAIKNIMTKAVEVFANVYNAIAGIPYVGPFLAPVMAVAAGATIVGLVGKVASAEGGWDRVPYDGAKAILHKEEMVLPAPLAEGIRGMIDGGASRGGNAPIIHALDRRDVQRYFDDNSEILFGSLMRGAQSNPGAF